MPGLFSPLLVRALPLKNRVVMPPMATETATEDGIATDRTVAHYERRARAGVGLIIVEHTYVLPNGRRSRRQLGIWRDACVPSLRRLAERIRSGGAAAVIQITHAGAASDRELIGEQPIAPSAVPLPLRGGADVPRAIAREDIPRLVAAFAEGARRAKEAGFDGVELHGAHGFLLNQFYSPLTNTRDDEYGGDRDGRLRFILDVVGAVRRAVGPDMIVLYRLGADDGIPGGLSVDDATYAALRLVEAGVDVIDVSGGLGGSGRDRLSGQGYFAPLSRAVKQAVQVPVIVTGGITLPEAADDIVRRGDADLVGIGRALLADPDWAVKARSAVPPPEPPPDPMREPARDPDAG